MAEAYSIKDTAKILGCSETKVRQYIKYEMLDSFKVGHKRMIKSKAIKKFIHKEHRYFYLSLLMN